MYLLRVGDATITRDTFEKRLAHARIFSTDGHGLVVDTHTSADHILQELVEELLIQQYAKYQNIGVTEVEVDQALADIRGELPQTEFETLIMESAQTLKGFRQNLYNRLLTEKVIRQAVMEQVAITVEDVASHFEEKEANGPRLAHEGSHSQPMPEDELREIRFTKGRAAYGQWLQSLRERYPVTIDPSIWRAMAESDRVTLNHTQSPDSAPAQARPEF